jgi:Protein of unknown function (DUF5131)
VTTHRRLGVARGSGVPLPHGRTRLCAAPGTAQVDRQRVPTCRLSGGACWVIAGGESGPGARSLELDWVRDLRDRRRHAGAALFVKQLGSAWGHGPEKGEDLALWPEDLRIREVPPMA